MCMLESLQRLDILPVQLMAGTLGLQPSELVTIHRDTERNYIVSGKCKSTEQT